MAISILIVEEDAQEMPGLFHHSHQEDPQLPLQPAALLLVCCMDVVLRGRLPSPDSVLTNMRSTCSLVIHFRCLTLLTRCVTEMV